MAEEKIELGDYVECASENTSGQVIAIRTSGLLMLLQVNDPAKDTNWTMDDERIHELNTRIGDKKCVMLGKPEDYRGAHCWWVEPCQSVLVKKGSSSSVVSTNNRICAVCGQYDDYAGPSAKHNNEVRCYRHC